MRAATVLALISSASAAALSARAECPTSSGSACGVVQVLGNTVNYPKCDCATTCSGPVSVAGITATVSIGYFWEHFANYVPLFAFVSTEMQINELSLSVHRTSRLSAKAV
ncbi:hypothetical protein NLG97_g5716 [Lecanicillium saksenae]|uniref:Uncharacterized protein n=1 Tax=Lecanicillium saksenae TaxID=468837 RepID=A0ACC1QU87_9HYPO|nr:hypothetical protein NLG97_g5716 [Lecanicillium saksenae]